MRTLGYLFLPKQSLEQKMWQDYYEKTLGKVKKTPLRVSSVLGIIKDFEKRYVHFEAACLELGVPYVDVDIVSNSWIKNVKESKCDGFLVWPSSFNSASKQMFDERLRIIAQDMGKIIFPSYNSLWIYESKRKMNDWLVLNGIPHPKTAIFFNKNDAMQFIETAVFPLVFKTDLGAVASGVEIVKNKKSAFRLINLCFGKGYVKKKSIWGDRQHGNILFQEYIANTKEWRVIRIGNSYFGHQKLKKGEFHSGSKLVGWYEPPRKLLDFCRDISEKGRFLSMDMDVFETEHGEYLVNELQAVFGSVDSSQMYINGTPGRFIYEKSSDSWKFEEGYFCQNASCDLRVKSLLKLLGNEL